MEGGVTVPRKSKRRCDGVEDKLVEWWWSGDVVVVVVVRAMLAVVMVTVVMVTVMVREGDGEGISQLLTDASITSLSLLSLSPLPPSHKHS